MPIRVDPVTGLKIFNTRAAKATEKNAGTAVMSIDGWVSLPAVRIGV